MTYIEGNVSPVEFGLCLSLMCQDATVCLPITSVKGGGSHLDILQRGANLGRYKHESPILEVHTQHSFQSYPLLRPLRIGRNPKGKDHLPTTVFSGVMLVLQRVLFFLTPSRKSWKFLLPFCLQKKKDGRKQRELTGEVVYGLILDHLF